ncbi:hypothetical protein Q4534_02960 [Cyclobacterium sp. 1_MG-2023]|uniref:hypothetical protein n=1 Tax=Cyclobacterium sp. 1_MG-2023 TaxID=3062681 RepID=UPI0026E11643|nr:hypothetical protein [Cyclobacterium sp. 1_MG-2023]MDO6436347.1 hypothetical protein [Cyclobacterium sp. 1_MG-2023]
MKFRIHGQFLHHGDFVSIVAGKWQQYRQNQDGWIILTQGLTPLAVVLRPFRAWYCLRIVYAFFG